MEHSIQNNHQRDLHYFASINEAYSYFLSSDKKPLDFLLSDGSSLSVYQDQLTGDIVFQKY